MEESNTKESLSCAGCLNDIGVDEYVSALGQDWHKDCFRCSVCDAALSSWYFEKAGLLFCQADYWARYGESCQQCAQVITGPVMSAGEHQFHPECFACGACGANIEDGQPYALLERSNLYCGLCYRASLSERAAGGAGGAGGAAARAHAIRVVEVPAAALRLAPLDSGALKVTQRGRARCGGGKVSSVARRLLRAALSVCIQFTCHRIESACGLLTLHLGDRVLEINGAPVRGRALRDIERTLAAPDALIQLTIEHNPEAGPAPAPAHAGGDDEQHRHDAQSPVERKIMKEDLKRTNIPANHSNGTEEESEGGVRKERLFKRKGAEGGRTRAVKRRQTPAPSPLLLAHKERSSSMSKLLDAVDGECEEASGVLRDLSRARSFRAEPAPGQKVFRACDLLQGELLGSGFFGQVYKVTHRESGEVMVLKQLYRVDEDAQRNFLKEVAVLRSLTHPNVLRFIGVLYKEKRLHLVTEYVAGGTLHHLLQDPSVPLSWACRARLARDVARGVGYLHRMNVIHRDLNSHNCLVREDRTVIVADFGLARIVQRTASSALERRRAHDTLRRKRYTVVGNPYWMAPEMMNGNVYDEKVDVFSFGIMLCEIIGRVSADPDFLPRRPDFGLNEAVFADQFCRAAACPEPLYRVAFLACHLDPDKRPPFEVLEIWLESLAMHLRAPGAPPPTLLADILQYGRGGAERGHATPVCCPHQDANIFCASEPLGACPCRCCGGLSRSPSAAGGETDTPEGGVVKSQSHVSVSAEVSALSVVPARALGKCVSASHICSPQRPIVTVTNLSRSQHALPLAGYILRAVGKSINITKVDDITEWLDPPPPAPKRASLAAVPGRPADDDHARKTRKVDPPPDVAGNLPSFLRNQSVEGLETEHKHEVDAPLPFCRHISIPDSCEVQANDSDSSSDDQADMGKWYKNVSTFRKMEKMDVDQSKNILAGIVKKGENLLAKKSSYDVTDASSRSPECPKVDRRVPDVDRGRYNADCAKKIPEAVKNIPKTLEVQKPIEKSSFFAKKLLSPKLSRLFKPNSAEAVRHKAEAEEEKSDKSRSKFFIQRPASPSNICRTSHRVRPVDDTAGKNESNILKSDLKLAGMGKPMTPIFRRHVQNERPEFADGRFSYRDRRPKYDFKGQEPKFIDVGRNRIKAPVNVVEKTKLAPLIRSSHANNIPALATVPEKKLGGADAAVKKREPGISRSNYVSLANLKINSKKNMEVDNTRAMKDRSPPVERVI